MSLNTIQMRDIFLRAVLITVLIGVLVEKGHAQGYATKPYAALEYYGGLGTTHYFGDVGGKSSEQQGLVALIDAQGVDIEQTRLGGIFGFRYIRNKTLAFNAQMKPMWLSGSDKNSMFQEKNLDRNYSFQSFLIDGSLSVEIFLANRLTGPAPYLILGFGGVLFNTRFFDQYLDPKDTSIDLWRNNNYRGGFDADKWTDLTLSGITVAGFGVRLPSLSRHMAQTIELRYHYATKDILDGYSLGVYNGDKKNPEHYGQIGDSYLVLSYQLIFDLDNTFVYDHRGRINR